MSRERLTADDLRISRWDSAEVLNSQEDIDDYLQVAFESNDPKHIAKALGVAARAKSMLKVARQTGLAREQLYSSLSDVGNPTLQTVTRVIDALGYCLAIKPKICLE